MTFIFWNSEVGIEIPPKILWQYWCPWIFRILRNKKGLNKKNLNIFPSCCQKYEMSFFLLALFISLMRSENFISMNAYQDWLETSRRTIRGISGSTTSSRLLPFWRRITCNKKEISILRKKNARTSPYETNSLTKRKATQKTKKVMAQMYSPVLKPIAGYWCSFSLKRIQNFKVGFTSSNSQSV